VGFIGVVTSGSPTLCVQALGDSLKVPWINAATMGAGHVSAAGVVMASMVNYLTASDCPIVKLIGKPVDFMEAIVSTDLTITALLIHVSDPRPAFIRGAHVYLRPESNFGRGGNFGYHVW